MGGWCGKRLALVGGSGVPDLGGVRASVACGDAVGCNGEGVSVISWHGHAEQIACCTRGAVNGWEINRR